MSSPIKIFISYCHRDEGLRKELETHLSPLQREGVIEHWHDRMIVPGDGWEDKIEEKLGSADLYLFLISPDFIASEYCYGKELTRALERHRAGDALVLPVVVRPVEWKTTALGQIQGLPKDGIPVTTWANADEAWVSVVNGVRTACRKISEQLRARSCSGVVFRTQTINSVLTSLVERIQERHDSDAPLVSGLPTGLADLDALIGGFEQKELILIASAPQIDRLGLILKFISNFSMEIGLPCALVCARHDEIYLGNRFLCATGKLPVREVPLGMLSDDQWSSLAHALGRVNEAPLSFVSYAGQSLDEVFQQLDELAKQYGVLAAIAIDSLDHLAGDKEKNIQALGNYARRTNKVVVVGCGLERNPDSRPNKRPVLADIGSWVPLDEHIDHVISVYLDQVYNPDTEDIGVAELLVQGMNNTRSGSVRVSYLPESQSYTNLKRRKSR